MKFCKLADIADWQDPEFQATAGLLQEGVRSRKAWEFIQVYQGLKQLGLLNGDSQALGLGVGQESLIFALANVCQHVVATDLYESQDWSTAALSVQEVYQKTPFPYPVDRLSVRHMDMRRIEYPDTSFDFVWSCCAIEHVPNFRDLHQVYQEIHRVLKPGGIAALTTEFNNTDRPSYEPHLLFTDRQWMEAWLTGADPLVQGFELIDTPSFELSDRPENQPVSRQVNEAIQVYCNDIVLNSVSCFLRKTGEFQRAYDEGWLPDFWRTYLAACDAHRDRNFAQAETLLRSLVQVSLPPRLRVRALRRLADTLFAQSNFDELGQVCLAALPDVASFQDEDQWMPLANYCLKTGLAAEAKLLYEMVETLPSANLELVIQSRLKQAKCHEQQGQLERALDLVGKAEQAIIPGDPTEAKFKPKVYFRTGFLYEKLGQLAPAIRFYKLAIEISAADPEFQITCYRRLTTCLQNQIKQANERAESLEAANRIMQDSNLWKLRSALFNLKGVLKKRGFPSG